MTNKRDWDQFVRSKDRFKVHEYFVNNRTDCFNIWLDSDKNWDSVKLHVDRLHAAQTKSKRGFIAIQGKDLKKTHTEQKALAIISARKASGMWYASEDFEDDDDEPRYEYMYVFIFFWSLVHFDCQWMCVSDVFCARLG